jgi:hypothetical protein
MPRRIHPYHSMIRRRYHQVPHMNTMRSRQMFVTKLICLVGLTSIMGIRQPRCVTRLVWLTRSISLSGLCFSSERPFTCTLLRQEYDGDEVSFTPEERSTVTFVNNRIYKHKVMRVNYTTYDLRRAQDSLNSRTHADIMVLSPFIERTSLLTPSISLPDLV